MRTTIDLPDDLFRQAKARAALDGTTLKELITRYVEQGLRRREQAPAGGTGRRRSKPPVARPPTGRPLPLPGSTNLQRILDEEEVAGGRAGGPP
jgi:hypothetical protein